MRDSPVGHSSRFLDLRRYTTSPLVNFSVHSQCFFFLRKKCLVYCDFVCFCECCDGVVCVVMECGGVRVSELGDFGLSMFWMSVYFCLNL